MKQATEHANAAVASGGLAKDSSPRADEPDADPDDHDNDRKGNGRDKDPAGGKDAGNAGHPAKEPKKRAGKGSDVDRSSVASAVPQSLIDGVAVVPSAKKPKK